LVFSAKQALGTGHGARKAGPKHTPGARSRLTLGGHRGCASRGSGSRRCPGPATQDFLHKTIDEVRSPHTGVRYGYCPTRDPVGDNLPLSDSAESGCATDQVTNLKSRFGVGVRSTVRTMRQGVVVRASAIRPLLLFVPVSVPILGVCFWLWQDVLNPPLFQALAFMCALTTVTMLVMWALFAEMIPIEVSPGPHGITVVVRKWTGKRGGSRVLPWGALGLNIRVRKGLGVVFFIKPNLGRVIGVSVAQARAIVQDPRCQLREDVRKQVASSL